MGALAQYNSRAPRYAWGFKDGAAGKQRSTAGTLHISFASQYGVPVQMLMHGIVETPAYLADVKSAGVSHDECKAISDAIAADPGAGDLIPGTGGARKVRVAGRGKGKSGGYRIITYFAAEDVPVFLLRLVSKGQRADISKAERNDVREALATIVADYREGQRHRLHPLPSE